MINLETVGNIFVNHTLHTIFLIQKNRVLEEVARTHIFPAKQLWLGWERKKSQYYKFYCKKDTSQKLKDWNQFRRSIKASDRLEFFGRNFENNSSLQSSKYSGLAILLCGYLCFPEKQPKFLEFLIDWYRSRLVGKEVPELIYVHCLVEVSFEEKDLKFWKSKKQKEKWEPALRNRDQHFLLKLSQSYYWGSLGADSRALDVSTSLTFPTLSQNSKKQSKHVLWWNWRDKNHPSCSNIGKRSILWDSWSRFSRQC